MPYQFQKGDLAEYNGPGLDEATAEQRLLAARSLLVRTFFPSFLLSTQEKLSIFGFLLAILWRKIKKNAKNAYLTVSIFKIFRGSMSPDPLEKRGPRPRNNRFAISAVPTSTSQKLACMLRSLTQVTVLHFVLRLTFYQAHDFFKNVFKKNTKSYKTPLFWLYMTPSSDTTQTPPPATPLARPRCEDRIAPKCTLHLEKHSCLAHQHTMSKSLQTQLVSWEVELTHTHTPTHTRTHARTHARTHTSYSETRLVRTWVSTYTRL